MTYMPGRMSHASCLISMRTSTQHGSREVCAGVNNQLGSTSAVEPLDMPVCLSYSFCCLSMPYTWSRVVATYAPCSARCTPGRGADMMRTSLSLGC